MYQDDKTITPEEQKVIDDYAYCRGKVCIGLKTDVRSLLPIGDNPMVECALRGTFGDIYEVSEWIRSRRWEQH